MPTRLALKDDLITETLSNAAYIFSNATPIHSVIDVGGPGGGQPSAGRQAGSEAVECTPVSYSSTLCTAVNGSRPSASHPYGEPSAKSVLVPSTGYMQPRHIS